MDVRCEEGSVFCYGCINIEIIYSFLADAAAKEGVVYRENVDTFLSNEFILLIDSETSGRQGALGGLFCQWTVVALTIWQTWRPRGLLLSPSVSGAVHEPPFCGCISSRTGLYIQV